MPLSLQLLCHIIGDYFLQSSNMAVQKSKSSFVCSQHIIIYASVFSVAIVASGYHGLNVSLAVLIIGVTHFLMDRWSLARFVIYAIERLYDKAKWEDCKLTGCDINVRHPAICAVVYVVVDNTIHIVINYWAIRLVVV